MGTISDQVTEIITHGADLRPFDTHGARLLYLTGIDIDQRPVEDNHIDLFLPQRGPHETPYLLNSSFIAFHIDLPYLAYKRAHCIIYILKGEEKGPLE
jgi:hypothetical protein